MLEFASLKMSPTLIIIPAKLDRLGGTDYITYSLEHKHTSHQSSIHSLADPPNQITLAQQTITTREEQRHSHE